MLNQHDYIVAVEYYKYLEDEKDKFGAVVLFHQGKMGELPKCASFSEAEIKKLEASTSYKEDLREEGRLYIDIKAFKVT